MTGTKKAKGGTANISKTTKAILLVDTCNLLFLSHTCSCLRYFGAMYHDHS